VNNIGAAHIANVYSQTVVNNATVNRASFNGGAGGVVARPTSEQLMAAKEPHIPATRPQVDQARASSMRGEQFLSTNRGKPAIAATERPGEFKGKGALPARAAGAAAQAVPAPGGNAEPESKEKPPAAEKPVKPQVVPNAPRIENPPTAEKPVKPEVAPNAQRIEEKPPAVERPVRPELPPAQPQPGFQTRPPAAERPAQPGSPNGMQRFERPPGAQPRPPQPERKLEEKECGRPGLPPCPR